MGRAGECSSWSSYTCHRQSGAALRPNHAVIPTVLSGHAPCGVRLRPASPFKVARARRARLSPEVTCGVRPLGANLQSPFSVMALAPILVSYALPNACPAATTMRSPVKQEQALPIEDCSMFNTQREMDECLAHQSKYSQQQLDSLLRELRPTLQP